MQFDLKPLSAQAIGGALAKAERYRLLNEPTQAESICRDVLAVDPEHQEATVMLILAITDQFSGAGGFGFDESRALAASLASEYHRAYYEGIICERRANTHFERAHPGSGHLAFEWYRKAMKCFERAEALSEPGNEEAKLRWNTCARTIMKHPSIESGAEVETPLMLE